MTHPRRRTAVDKRRVGLSFIEVLFALVVARALDPLAKFDSIPAIGLSHLALAFVLAVTSWIGYHNSWNRPRFYIRFANLPLWQFVFDVLLVVAYWFCAVSAEGTGTDLGRSASALPESIVVAVSFVLCSLLPLGLGWLRHSEIRPLSRQSAKPRCRTSPLCYLGFRGTVGYIRASRLDVATKFNANDHWNRHILDRSYRRISLR